MYLPADILLFLMPVAPVYCENGDVDRFLALAPAPCGGNIIPAIWIHLSPHHLHCLSSQNISGHFKWLYGTAFYGGTGMNIQDTTFLEMPEWLWSQKYTGYLLLFVNGYDTI